METLHNKIAVAPVCWTGVCVIILNQIFDFSCCITPKCVTSWRVHLRVIAPMGNTAPFEEMLQRWRAVGNIVSDLTDSRFERHASRSRKECVTAQPTGRFVIMIIVIKSRLSIFEKVIKNVSLQLH